MKNKSLLIGALFPVLVFILCAAVPSLTDFNLNQFDVTTRKVALRNGVLTTNLVEQTAFTVLGSPSGTNTFGGLNHFVSQFLLSSTNSKTLTPVSLVGTNLTVDFALPAQSISVTADFGFLQTTNRPAAGTNMFTVCLIVYNGSGTNVNIAINPLVEPGTAWHSLSAQPYPVLLETNNLAIFNFAATGPSETNVIIQSMYAN